MVLWLTPERLAEALAFGGDLSSNMKLLTTERTTLANLAMKKARCRCCTAVENLAHGAYFHLREASVPSPWD